MSSLADRIRGIVAPAAGRSDPPDPPALPVPAAHADLDALGGAWRDDVFVVERRVAPQARHGREAIGTFAECLDESSSAAPLYGGAGARPPLVFFDLETTGLSGGAGTQAFLVGCARFDDERGFVTRQFLLTGHAGERPMLDVVARELAAAGALVSFNGKSFDAPMLETRYLFHRLAWNGREQPHVDVLHPARRFWHRGSDGARAVRENGARTFQASDACSLAALEKQILGVRRSGDVASFEIPRRYFAFVRSGDARQLAAVLEHNRLDLLSLAALTARLFHVARHGPDAVRDAREALALGHVYLRAGLDARACDAYRRAVEMTERGIVSQAIRIESLRALAISYRRARQHADAAACWRRLVEAPGCPPRVAREATEALAVHHEHRDRDLAAAKAFALKGLELDAQPAWTTSVTHRLARIERKMSGASAQLRLSSSLS
jgi:uncharacterized protein